MSRIKRHAKKIEFEVIENFKKDIGINMEKQFKNYQTFFDEGIDNLDINIFSTLCCTISNVKKKRSYRNKSVLKYLKGKELTEEEKELCDLVLNGKIYQVDKDKEEHCELCQSKLNRTNISNRYTYWDIVIPSRPYYPGSVMLVLKERKIMKIENIQELSFQEFDELKKIIVDLYDIVRRINNYKIVGVNVLFNQISKSQLCIHGHVEFMISEAHKQNIGYHLKTERTFDKLAEYINNEIKYNDTIKVLEGIKIDLENNKFEKIKKILDAYDYEIKKYINKAKAVRDSNIANNYMEELFIHNLSPAPVNYIYITYYRDRLLLSSIPEILLKSVNVESLDENNEYHLYTLKVNQYAKEKDDLLLEHESPFLRPSTKIENKTIEYEKAESFNNQIIKLMNEY